MRLCLHEGEFLPRTYDALSTRYSWEEVQRIRASIFVIEDERADYGRWHSKNHERIDKLLAGQANAGKPGDKISLDDYKKALDENRQGLENARKDLQAHRGALTRNLGAEDGLLPVDQVAFIEEAATAHEDQIERIEAAISELVAADGASLMGDTSS